MPVCHGMHVSILHGHKFDSRSSQAIDPFYVAFGHAHGLEKGPAACSSFDMLSQKSLDEVTSELLLPRTRRYLKETICHVGSRPTFATI